MMWFSLFIRTGKPRVACGKAKLEKINETAVAFITKRLEEND